MNSRRALYKGQRIFFIAAAVHPTRDSMAKQLGATKFLKGYTPSSENLGRRLCGIVKNVVDTYVLIDIGEHEVIIHRADRIFNTDNKMYMREMHKRQLHKDTVALTEKYAGLKIGINPKSVSTTGGW